MGQEPACSLYTYDSSLACVETVNCLPHKVGGAGGGKGSLCSRRRECACGPPGAMTPKLPLRMGLAGLSFSIERLPGAAASLQRAQRAAQHTAHAAEQSARRRWRLQVLASHPHGGKLLLGLTDDVDCAVVEVAPAAGRGS